MNNYLTVTQALQSLLDGKTINWDGVKMWVRNDAFYYSGEDGVPHRHRGWEECQLVEEKFKPITSNVRYVTYFGCTIPVQEWVQYLATDENGKLFGYDSLPIIGDGDGFWIATGKVYNTGITITNYQGNWKQSLVYVPE